jgi:hypothetical protein
MKAESFLSTKDEEDDQLSRAIVATMKSGVGKFDSRGYGLN